LSWYCPLVILKLACSACSHIMLRLTHAPMPAGQGQESKGRSRAAQTIEQASTHQSANDMYSHSAGHRAGSMLQDRYSCCAVVACLYSCTPRVNCWLT
jgi:hypothetical protein